MRIRVGVEGERRGVLAILTTQRQVALDHAHFTTLLGAALHPDRWSAADGVFAGRRLELATKILVESDRPVGEVGQAVGWPDANYFPRRFHSQFGLTPTAYRNRTRVKLKKT